MAFAGQMCLGRLNSDLRQETSYEVTKTISTSFENEFILQLAYLADILGHLNETGLFLADRDTTVSDVRAYIISSPVSLESGASVSRLDSRFFFGRVAS